MATFPDKSFTLGILGGGQLGRMLIQAALNLDFRIHVLDPHSHAPCAHICHQFTVGSLTDFDTVYRFGKQADVVTIEIENVNVEALGRLSTEGIQVFPQPEIIRTIQDKGFQKEFFQKKNIPTAPFELVEGSPAVHNFRQFFPFVQKLRREGYDGRGVMKISSDADRKRGFDKPSVLEAMIDIDKELSIIVGRNQAGETKTYPPIEMIFHPTAHLVEYLLAPARITDAVAKKAAAIAGQVAEEFKLVGLMAVEMFLTNDGDVLVNELAPRPHNSGHHTIEANITSQYEQHLRAILGLPLGSTDSKSPAVMINILGEEGYDGIARYEGLDEALNVGGASVHLYGKQITRPFRKMGHVTVVDSSIESALKKAEFIKHHLKVVA